MKYSDGHTSSAPMDKEQNYVRLTAAKTRANDCLTLEEHFNSLEKAIQTATEAHKARSAREEQAIDAICARLEALIKGVPAAPDDERLKEDIPAEEDALDRTEVRDVEEPGKDVPAEEVVLDTTVDQDGEEPGEDASPEGIALDRKTARDYVESREDEPPTKSDNFDDTDSEDSTVPTPVTNPTPTPASDPTLQDRPPSTPFRPK
ncbi:hypothetical protein THAOC_18201, partial [Thalassiosira oceanica]